MYQIYANGNLIYQPGNDRLRLTSPKLTVEMGKAGALQFGIPPTHPYYGNLQQLKAILTVSEGDDELFRGRVLSNKRNFNNIREIYGEGNLSYLVDSVQKPKKYKGKTEELFRAIIDRHNGSMDDRVNPGTNPENKLKQFVVGHIDEELIRDAYIPGKDEDTSALDSNNFDYNQIVIDSEVDEWQTTFDFLESGLLDTAGGYLRTRYVPEEDKTYIDWYKDHYSETNQTIMFGKNMLDLIEENNAEDAFSVLIPIGDENLTIEKITDVIVPGYVREDENGNWYYYILKYANELVHVDAVKKYGRIVKTKVFDGVTKASTLLENGARYLKEHAIPPATITITAVDLHILNPGVQPIHVGDKVHVISAPHNVDDSDLVCTKIEYDLTNPANTVYTFGKPKQDLTERYRKDKKKDISGRGGGGGAAKKAEENANENQINFWSAVCNIDSENATIDLNAMFRQLYNPEGDPNKDNDLAIKSYSQILFGATPDGSDLNLISDYNNKLEHISNQAGIDIVTGKNGPELHLFINDKTNGRRADINFGTGVRSIYHPDTQTYVDEPASTIALISDVFETENKLTKFVTDKFEVHSDLFSVESKLIQLSGYTVADGIECKNVTCTSLFFGDKAFSWHSHAIEEDPVQGTITIGNATFDGKGSFKIANTKTFKDMVKALTVTSLDFNFETAAKCTVDVKAKNADGTVLYKDSETNPKWPTKITITPTKKVASGKSYYTISVTPYNNDNKSIKRPDNTTFSTKDTGTEAYDDGYDNGYDKGKDSVTVKLSDTYVTYHSSNGVRVHIGLSNGKSGTYNLAFND